MRIIATLFCGSNYWDITIYSVKGKILSKGVDVKASQAAEPKYHLNNDGSFVIENYNAAKPFSNFFPGVAGVWGIPMWVFYVNRGQCIASFGIESKDKAIVEFQPANKAYRLTSLHGFRTFLKIKFPGKDIFWEPFQSHAEPNGSQQRMLITSHDLTLDDSNAELGLKVSVNYFTLPNESFAGLARVLTIENISKKNISLEAIDGLPSIIPFGIKDWVSKNMS